MLILFSLLFLLFSGCAHSINNAIVPESDEPYVEVLDNGLKVFIVKDPNAPLAVFQIWYNAGSIHEQVGKTGLSHFLEHMMFKGTRKYGPKTFSKMIKRAGGIDNAGTSKDFVYYYQKLSADRLNLSIELEADRMRNLIIDPDEVVSERDVIMEERRMRYDDDPQNLVYEEVMATAFKSHPYHWPVIGWMSDIKGLTREDLLKYYRKHYVPNNAFIIAAGDLDVGLTMARIRKEFGSIPRGPEVQPVKIKEPIQRGEKRIFVRKEAELPYVLSAYKAPTILNGDSYAIDVLAIILSGGKSGRIYKSLIDEKRIALSAGAGYSNIQKHPNLFYLYGVALPGNKIEGVENVLYEEIEKIKNQPPTEREMQKARNQVEAEFIMDQDSIFSQAMMIAQFELIGDWRLKDRYVDGIRKVTAGDVQRVAKKYLVEDNRTVGILIPLKKQSPDVIYQTYDSEEEQDGGM